MMVGFWDGPFTGQGWQSRQSNRQRGHLTLLVNQSSQFAINH